MSIYKKIFINATTYTVKSFKTQELHVAILDKNKVQNHLNWLTKICVSVAVKQCIWKNQLFAAIIKHHHRDQSRF